jgi:distribution and morphology protein 34
MAFRFQWPKFSPEFIEAAKTQLTTSLNKGNKPKNIVDQIEVIDLSMGTKVTPFSLIDPGGSRSRNYGNI